MDRIQPIPDKIVIVITHREVETRLKPTYIYVCMYVWLYVCMYVCMQGMYVRMYV